MFANFDPGAEPLAPQIEGFDEMARELSEGLAYIHQEDIGIDKVWAGLKAPMTEQGCLSPFEKINLADKSVVAAADVD